MKARNLKELKEFCWAAVSRALPDQIESVLMTSWRDDPLGMVGSAMWLHRANAITKRAAARGHPSGTGDFDRLPRQVPCPWSPPLTAGLSLPSAKIVLSEWFNLVRKCSRSSCVAVIAAAVLLFIPGRDVKAAESQAQVTPERGIGVEQRQQQRKSSEDYKPIGARVGSFIFLPSIDVEAEYSDNVFATQTGAQSDTLTRIMPEIALKSDWNRHELNLAFKPEIVRYYRLSDDNVENYDFTANGRVDLLRILKIDMSAGYNIGHEDRGNPNAVTSAKSPTKTKTTNAHIEVNYKPNWVSLDIDGDFTKNDFNDVTNNDGTITNNDDRDRDKKEIAVRLGREYLPNTEMFVRASYNAINYKDALTDSGENRDSDGYSIVVGTGLDFTKVVTGDVFGGYISQSYADASLEKIAGPTAGASINWDVTPLMSINGAVSRTIQETTTAGSPGFMSSFVSLTVDYEILRPLTATANIRGTAQKYEGVGRADKILDASLGGEYQFNRNLSLSLNYAFKRKLSSSAGLSSTRNTVLLAGRAQF